MVKIIPPSHKRFGGFILPVLPSGNLSEKLKLWYNIRKSTIPIEENLRRDVSVMCNLSQGIEEDGIAIVEAIIEGGKEPVLA